MLAIANLGVQCQEISFSDWVSLLTLCLAPLVAHILAGAPQPSLLVSSQPRWHDRMCIWNPTTILCRYAAIVDRRIRARESWDPVDAAAANAIFWTCRGWVGSDFMALETLPLCTLMPERGTVRLLSTEMLKTIVVTMQGLQASVMLVGGATGTIMYNQYFGLDWVFGPLTIMGLLRLLAAPWLTSDFMYSIRTAGTGSTPPDRLRDSVDSLCIPSSEEKTPHMMIRYRSTSYRPSRCFRLLYLSLLVSSWLLAVWWTFIKPCIHETGLPLTASAFLAGALYVFALASIIIIFFYYHVRHESDSTILPCVGATWYKIYTIFFMLFMAVVFLLVALETYKTPCGTYTSLPRKCADLVCKARTGEVTGAIAECY